MENGPRRQTHFLILGCTWFIFCAHSSIMPHLTRYYDLDLKLSDKHIGYLMAAQAFLTMILQPVWGILADRYFGRTNTYRLVLILAGCFTVTFPFAYDIGGYPLLMVNAVLMYANFMSNAPLLTSLILSFLGKERAHEFPKIRVVGSISFALTIFFVCPLMVALSESLERHARDAVVWGGAVFICASLLCTFWNKDHFESHERAPLKSFITLAKKPTLIALYASTFCIAVSTAAGFQYIGPYFGYLGYSERFFSTFWLLGVSIEVALSLCLKRLIPSVGLKRLIAIGIFADAVRWFGFSMFVSKAAILFFSVSHGMAVIAVFFLTSIYIDSECDKNIRSTAQAMIFFAIFAGHITGFLGGSWIVSNYADLPRALAIQSSFIWFGIASLIGGFICVFFVKPEPPKPVEPTLPMDEMAC